MDLGENFITFKVSRDGRVLYSPERSIVSTSHEMEIALKEIADKTAKHMEDLLKEKFRR